MKRWCSAGWTSAGTRASKTMIDMRPRVAYTANECSAGKTYVTFTKMFPMLKSDTYSPTTSLFGRTHESVTAYLFLWIVLIFLPLTASTTLLATHTKTNRGRRLKIVHSLRYSSFDGIFSAAGAVSLFPWFIGCALVVALNAHKARMLRQTRGLVFASSTASATTFLLSWYLFLSGVAFNNRLW